MPDSMISYARFTRRVTGNRIRERFELRVEETVQGYALVRQLDEQSCNHPAPMRTETAYCELDDALADFEATVSYLSLEGSYRLREFSHADTVFNGASAPLAAGY